MTTGPHRLIVMITGADTESSCGSKHCRSTDLNDIFISPTFNLTNAIIPYQTVHFAIHFRFHSLTTGMAYSKLSLAGLPDEIFQQILYHVPPASIPALQQASKRFNDRTDEPLLWRHYCGTEFRYWSVEHGIRRKFGGYVADVDWKKLYEHRCAVDRTTRRIIDSILASQMGRIEKFQSIAELGYDAKDTLMQQYRIGDDAEDALARRYALLRARDTVSGRLMKVC